MIIVSSICFWIVWIAAILTFLFFGGSAMAAAVLNARKGKWSDGVAPFVFGLVLLAGALGTVLSPFADQTTTVQTTTVKIDGVSHQVVVTN